MDYLQTLQECEIQDVKVLATNFVLRENAVMAESYLRRAQVIYYMKTQYFKEWQLKEWEIWLEKECGLIKRTGYESIKLLTEFSDNECATAHKLSENLKDKSRNDLRLIASIPKDERDKKHYITETDEEKSVYEMTSKQLRQLKKQLTEKDKVLNGLQAEIERAKKQAAEFKEKEAAAQKQAAAAMLKVKELEENPIMDIVEVLPKETQKQLERAEMDAKFFKTSAEQKDEHIAKLEKQLQGFKEAFEDPKQQEAILRSKQMEARINISDLQKNVNYFLRSNAHTTLMHDYIALLPDQDKDELLQSIVLLEKFCNKIRTSLKAKYDMKTNGNVIGGIFSELE